jgi:hypothetical protein
MQEEDSHTDAGDEAGAAVTKAGRTPTASDSGSSSGGGGGGGGGDGSKPSDVHVMATHDAIVSLNPGALVAKGGGSGSAVSAVSDAGVQYKMHGVHGGVVVGRGTGTVLLQLLAGEVVVVSAD